jgi:hypothetical protein
VTERKELGLTICVDPTRSDADPGTYVGSIRISSRFIQPVTVPVTGTLQQPGYRWIAPLFGVLTLLAGSFTVWDAGKKAQQGASSTPGVESVWKDLRQLPAWMLDNYVGVVAGAIDAISVFVAKYWRNPAWGARAPEDWLALLGSVFTAYTASLTAATAFVPPHRRSQWTSSAEESRGALPRQVLRDRTRAIPLAISGEGLELRATWMGDGTEAPRSGLPHVRTRGI